LLTEPGFSGKVLAAFSTTIYLLGNDGEIIWVALEGLPAHRRSLLASLKPGSVSAGQGFFTQDGCLRIGQDVAIELDQAMGWEPSAIGPERVASLPVVNACLQRLFAVLPGLGTGVGLGQAIPLISAIEGGRGVTAFPLNSLLARASSPILDMAKASLGQDMAEVTRKGRELVGLGPGLTPSGDDFVGGLLFAAHSLKTAYPGDFYWEQEFIRDLIDWARIQTNPISHTVLSDLALGHGPEPLHDVASSLLTGQDFWCLMAAVTRLLGFGHSSGWDILGGVLTGMLLVKGRLTLGSLNPKEKWRRTLMATEDIKQKVEAANAETVRRINAADPVLIDIAPAGDVIPRLKDRMILHSGPPVDWLHMCGAQRGAMIGAVLFEGWAKSVDEASKLLERGAIQFEPNHHHQAVGPMAGTITASMPVWVVENKTFGNRAFCRQVEGRQQFGDYSDTALESLRLWKALWAPALRKAILHMGGLSLKPIIAKALQMGDELHNRPVAASSLFANALAGPLVKAGIAKEDLLSTLGYITNHELLFLGLSMASGKASADPAAGVEYSTVVVAMARNGTEFGIRVSGLGDEWFTAPSPRINGLYLPGYAEQDAGADMGDSAITETVGWGGFVLAGATGILSLVGGSPEEALAYSREMRQITVAASPHYRMPILGFQGAPVGIDIRKVVQTGIVPIIDTAIAHKNPGYPIIGAGLVRAPLDCFKKALRAFGQKYGLK
jgi:hypothetical protein